MSDAPIPAPDPAPSTAAETEATAAPAAEAEASDAEEAVMDAMELRLLTLKECFVYAVPRLATATGYRAEDWGLAHPLVTGSLQCIRKGDDRLFLRIYAAAPSAAAAASAAPGEDGAAAAAAPPASPRLFAEAPIDLGKGPKGQAPPPLEASFLPVVDSSRYFVIKVLTYARTQLGAGCGGGRGQVGMGIHECRCQFGLGTYPPINRITTTAGGRPLCRR